MKKRCRTWIDLHIHLDGSISLPLAKKLALTQNMPVLSDEELMKRMSAGENCKDLNDYLTKFDYPLSLLQTEDALETSVYELLKLQEKQGLIYTEIRFAPQLHMQKGLTQRRVTGAAVRGLQKFCKESDQLTASLILCCMRGKGNELENRCTVETAVDYLGKGVSAIDLAGAEGLFPTRDFEELFAYAKRFHLPFTIHAGEADGPDSIWKALLFGAKRIGHGIRCLEDPELVRYLAVHRIPLEICPTSNLNTQIFANLNRYPLRELMDADLCVTINTDNMTVSGVTVQSEMERLVETFALTDDEVKQLLYNSAEAAFVSDDLRVALKKRISEN